jgi:hypothetical protein
MAFAFQSRLFLSKLISKRFSSSTEGSFTELTTKLVKSCKENPLPKLSSSAPKLPLEQLIPFFLVLYTINQQSILVNGPIFCVVMKENNFTVISDEWKLDAKTKSFVPFSVFNNSGKIKSEMISDPEHMKTAYLALSYFAKCNQVTTCFGILVENAISNGYQFTYGGEKIIGWGIYDGLMKLDSNINFNLVTVKSVEEIPHILRSVAENKEVSGYKVAYGNEIHVWLTFVTESGRVFDLDLSAFQYGHVTPIPYIFPATPIAFNGTCERKHLLGVNMPDFLEIVEQMMLKQVELVQINNPIFTLETYGEILKEIGRKCLVSALWELPNYFQDSNRLWNILSRL